MSNINYQTNISTHLYCGDTSFIRKIALKKIQAEFCLSKHIDESCNCNECRKIKNNIHPNVIFIKPEKQYVLKDLDVIFEKTKFAIEKNTKFFFVLEKSDLLTTSCANKMLKILEEPPTGYNFLLLTNNEQSIIPTIRSRCQIHKLNNRSTEHILNPLLTFFIDKTQYNDPVRFEETLKELKLNEHNSFEIVDELLGYLQEKMKEDISNEKTKQLLDFFKQKLKRLPRQGSSNLFWKNIFLNFPRL